MTVVLGSPEDWIRRARSDLTLAQTSPEVGVLLEDLCFHAQQAAEKAFKAVLIARSVSVPRTHSITRLLELMPESGALPQAVREAAVLTDYAVATRYPGAYEPVEDQEYREAVVLAESVVSWAESEVVDQGVETGRAETAGHTGESPDVEEVSSNDGSE